MDDAISGMMDDNDGDSSAVKIARSRLLWFIR